MLSVNMDDVYKVIASIKSYLIAFGVILVAGIIILIAAGKIKKPLRQLVRGNAGIAILLALLIVLNLVLTGPMSTLLDLVSGGGQINETTSAEATELVSRITEEGVVLAWNEDDILPVAPGSKLNVFGWSSTNSSPAPAGQAPFPPPAGPGPLPRAALTLPPVENLAAWRPCHCHPWTPSFPEVLRVPPHSPSTSRQPFNIPPLQSIAFLRAKADAWMQELARLPGGAGGGGWQGDPSAWTHPDNSPRTPASLYPGEPEKSPPPHQEA